MATTPSSFEKLFAIDENGNNSAEFDHIISIMDHIDACTNDKCNCKTLEDNGCL
jgi:hypothetical protein